MLHSAQKKRIKVHKNFYPMTLMSTFPHFSSLHYYLFFPPYYACFWPSWESRKASAFSQIMFSKRLDSSTISGYFLSLLLLFHVLWTLCIRWEKGITSRKEWSIMLLPVLTGPQAILKIPKIWVLLITRLSNIISWSTQWIQILLLS